MIESLPKDVFILSPNEPELNMRLTIDEFLKIGPILSASPQFAKQLQTRERVLLCGFQVDVIALGRN